MAKTLEQVLVAMPEPDRAEVLARAAELQDEIDGLRVLRQLQGRTQSDVARSLGVRQPSVHQLEGQADMQISTARRYVEALGGQLDLVVTLPGARPFKLSLG